MKKEELKNIKEKLERLQKAQTNNRARIEKVLRDYSKMTKEIAEELAKE